MELQELKDIWIQQDQGLKTQVEVNTKLLKTASFAKLRSLIGLELKLSVIIELCVYFLFLIFLANFVKANHTDVRFLIPAVILIIDSIIEMGWNVYQLFAYYSLDPSLPITRVQKRIQTLIIGERRSIILLIVFIPFFFLLFATVLLKAFLGLSLYDFLDKYIFWYLYGGSILLGPIMAWILMKVSNKELSAANEFLKEIKKFEQEQ